MKSERNYMEKKGGNINKVKGNVVLIRNKFLKLHLRRPLVQSACTQS